MDIENDEEMDKFSVQMQVDEQEAGGLSSSKHNWIIYKLVQNLSTIGSLLQQLGENKECEQCYSYYVAIIEL